MIEEEKAESIRQLSVSSAFTAWQLGAGSGQTFKEYLKKMGLYTGEIELTKEQREIVAKISIEKAERHRQEIQKRRGL